MNATFVSSMMMMMMAAIVVCPSSVVQSFVLQPGPQHTVPISRMTTGLYGGSESSSAKNDEKQEQPQQSNNTKVAEFGVSYIGGDPCGSKYNDDPFDVQVQKPGMPDDMKARIQALVEKRVAEEKEEQAAKRSQQQ